MKAISKWLSGTFLVFLLMACTSGNQSIIVKVDDIERKEKVLILVHPTVNNIKTFSYLIENRILSIPSNTKVVGLYHVDEVYDYTESAEYIHNKQLKNFKLLPVKKRIEEQNIFSVNGCTDVFTKIARVADGIIFTGGPDIPPSIYVEKTTLLTQIIDPKRHYFEVSFLFHLIGGSRDTLFVPLLNAKPLMPIVGICLGMQTMNVAAGGNLIQDIPTELYGITSVEDALTQQTNHLHRNYYTNLALDDKINWGNFHQIDIIDEPLKSMCSGKPWVLSSHHQCVDQLGWRLKSIALSTDGRVVEAVRHSVFSNVVGVQFHPEPILLYSRDEYLRFVPNQPSRLSYLDMYSGEAGEKFHRNFWSWFGRRFIEN